MQIKIPVMIGSNGKWSAYGHGRDGEPHDCDDWGMLADNLMDYPERGDPVDPDTSTRMYIIVDVQVPSVEVKEAKDANIEPVEAS